MQPWRGHLGHVKLLWKGLHEIVSSRHPWRWELAPGLLNLGHFGSDTLVWWGAALVIVECLAESLYPLDTSSTQLWEPNTRPSSMSPGSGWGHMALIENH